MPSADDHTLPPAGGTATFSWQALGRAVDVPYDIAGEGPPVLLLPAMGPASTRAEMGPLVHQLKRHFRTVTVDWPGFGASTHPRRRWRPELYDSFLAEFCAQVLGGSSAVVGVGHAAGYILRLARDRPSAWWRIALVAPTWRGPLPTVVGERRLPLAILRRLLELPLLGEALYRLSVAPPVLARITRAHAFEDPARLTPRLLDEKARVTRRRNARYAAAAFVTGGLDPVRERTAFLDLVDGALVPLLAVCGTATPAPFWQEMAALINRPGVTVSRVPGALAPHEEHPAPVSRAVVEFLLSASRR